MRGRQLIIGLVGALGSGKSTVAEFFRKRGVECIDADRMAHTLLDRPQVRRAIIREFGSEVAVDGRIDRAALGRVAFTSRHMVRRLNALMHPLIARQIRRAIRQARGILLIDAPLLQESGADAWCDAIIYVDAPRAVRQARVACRSWSPGELRRRERFQWSPARKRSQADFVIQNAGSLQESEAQVREMYTILSEWLRKGKVSHGTCRASARSSA